MTSPPAPTTPTIISTPATVTTGMPGLTASVPAQAASSYTWTITGGTITSATTGTSITFTAGAPGSLVLGCTVTNADGLASTPGSLTLAVVGAPTTLQSQIRALMATRLRTATGLTVLASPRAEVPAVNLPAIFLFSKGDKPQNEHDNMTTQHPRIYQVRVEIRVPARSEESATDTLAVQVRQALLQDETFQGNFPDTALDGLAIRITWMDQQWDGVEEETPISGTVLDFNVHYLWTPE